MAEDAGEEDIGEDEVVDRIRKEQQPPYQKPCNTRIDELAMPTKRRLLALFREHGYLFPREKNERLKDLLSILYAMTPEETAKYFMKLRADAKEAALKKKMKIKLKHLVARKKKRELRHRAYVLFRNIMKVGLMHAATHDVPPLVSVRLRNLSDIILQQLCDLREVSVPDRSSPDKMGHFLIAVADWIAIAVENIYYTVQLKKNEELEEIEEIERARLEEEMQRKYEEGAETIPGMPEGETDFQV